MNPENRGAIVLEISGNAYLVLQRRMPEERNHETVLSGLIKEAEVMGYNLICSRNCLCVLSEKLPHWVLKHSLLTAVSTNVGMH